MRVVQLPTEMASRKKMVTFRATEEEEAHVRAAAADAGLKLSDYLRACVLHSSVVAFDGHDVTVIASTVTPELADARLLAKVSAIVAGLNGQEQSPAPAPSAPPAAAAAPGSAPAATTSPGEGEPMAGASSQEPPAVVPAAGAIPGPGETIRTTQEGVAPGELEPLGACPQCGGTAGRHQGFCPQLTGHSPVTDKQGPLEDVEPGQPTETREQFLERRIGEGELAVVAEAEWRSGAEPEPADRRVPCPTCGALKLPEAQCADCGTRPQT